MEDANKSRFFKIVGCVSVYVLFVVVMFNINIQDNTLLVLLSTFIGSVVVVASYHEYRGTLIHVPSKNKAKAKSSFIEPQTILAPEPLLASKPQEEPTMSGCEDGLPTFDLTMFTPEILKKVSDLHVDDEIQDEIFNALKEIPPEQRLKYVDDIFQTNVEFDATY